MLGGVHLSTGNVGTGSSQRLFATGFFLVLLGATATVLAYVITWIIGEFVGVPLVGLQLHMATPHEIPEYTFWEIALNLLTFLSFLVVVRLSPLSAYHAAEHKVVHAIERHGYASHEAARAMPRSHRRCGTTLLAGVLPAMLIAAPLTVESWPLAIMIVLLGWTFRYPAGHLIQQVFTTKEPSDRQLRTALEAGRLLLERWRRSPSQPIPPLQSLWRRGLVQMFAGVITGTFVLGQLYDHVHLILDWGQYLP